MRAASVIDLLAIGFSRRESDVALAEPMARKALQRFGSLKSLGEAGATDLTAATGLENFEVLRAQALIEIGRRCAKNNRGEITSIDSPDDVFELLSYLQGEKREHFVAILLDAKSQVMRVANIHIGTLTASIVGPREVFREAIRDGASSIIVAHNHPSGDPSPSPEDVEVTHKLIEIGQMLDIPVLDHIIIGERRALSLREGIEFGGQVGSNRINFARESTGYARSAGGGAWPLPEAGPARG
ncbi:DNA repair protein RadC [Fimbriimonas ginsengisoli Gsoil 348]|uniref:DNA repair protein RadC n=1 Tax=Fimbriimonas ginsengisoli Gsoil 348 TaxID=661478 RepID=A0A068NWT8_FIMGI|nr:DNA repair protein RadC [Fimbriimonas ginsengisoli Gsoil 348]